MVAMYNAIVLLVTTLAAAAAADASDITHVRQHDDLHAAVHGALARVRDHDVELILHGVHHLGNRPLELPGRIAHRLTIRGDDADGGGVSGGVPVTGPWTAAADSNGNVTLYTAPLPAGVHAPDVGCAQAWQGGARLVRARSPTYQYAAAGADGTYLVYKQGQVAPTYHDFSRVHFVLYESWTASLHRLAAVHPENNTAYFQTRYNPQWAGQAAGMRYYVENAREELDEAGEFYCDRVARTITVATAAGAGAPTGVVVPSGLVELVTATGGGDDADAAGGGGGVTFTNVIFEYSAAEMAGCFAGSCDGQSAAFLTTAAIHLENAHGYRIEHSTLQHLGGYAVWLGPGCVNSSLASSHVADTGAGGVRVGSNTGNAGVPAAGANAGCAVTDNVLEDGGHVFQEGAGVLAQNGLADLLLSHNEIRYYRPSQFRGTPDCNERLRCTATAWMLTVAESFAKF